jgi:hypothetical protein
MLKQLAVVTSVAAFSLVPAKALANPSVKLTEETIASTSRSLMSDRHFHLAISSPESSLTDLNHDLYGITKSISKKLGLDTRSDEVDDDTEGMFREHALFFLLFCGLFGWMVFKSLSEVKR